MLKITQITNSTNYQTNFKAKSDYARVYKKMVRASGKKPKTTLSGGVVKTGLIGSLATYIVSTFVNNRAKINNPMLSKENILNPIDEEGNTFAHKATYEEWKIIYQMYKNNPNMLIKIYSAQNKDGNFPAYNFGRHAATKDNYKYKNEKFEIMNKVLEDNIFAAKNIYLTRNKNGERIIDLVSDKKAVYKVLEQDRNLVQKLMFNKNEKGEFVETDVDTVIKYLKDKPDLLAKYFISKNHPNRNNHLGMPLTTENLSAGAFTVERMNKIHQALINQPNVLYKIYVAPHRHYDVYREEYIETTMTPKDKFGLADKIYGKAFLENIIDLAKNPDIAPNKAILLLQLYMQDGCSAGLENEFKELWEYLETLIV